MIGTSRRKIVLVGVVVLFGTLGIFFFARHGDAPSSETAAAPESLFRNGESADEHDADFSQIYEHHDGTFSFWRPADYAVSLHEVEGGELLHASGPEGREFQIFVAPFDEALPLSSERILQERPELVMQEAEIVRIGGRVPESERTAVIFFSERAAIGRSREVWFNAGGMIFQLTARPDMDDVIGPMLETFAIH